MVSVSVMSLLPNGQYKIFNVQFVGQDADLLYGRPTAAVVGHYNNTKSLNMVWNLNNVPCDKGDQVTLTNAAQTANGAYASLDQATAGAAVHGSPNPVTWTVVPTDQPGQYWIQAPSPVSSNTPSGLVWSLSNSEDATPVKLAELGYNDLSQVWTFMPWNSKNAASLATGLGELD